MFTVGQNVIVITLDHAPGIVLETTDGGVVVAFNRFGKWAIETFPDVALKAEGGTWQRLKNKLGFKEPEQPTTVARPVDISNLPAGVHMPPPR